MTDAEWTVLIETARLTPPQVVRALTFLRSWPSFSTPAAVTCDDGHTYIAKGRNGIEGALAAEQIVGRAAVHIAAPVPTVMLVQVTDLRAIEPQMATFAPRLAHGSREVDEPCGDRMHQQHGFAPENRERFAALCVLYSWCGCWSDHQFIYGNSAPHLVYSVDHGHFFPSGPNWTAATLQTAPQAIQDSNFDGLTLTDAELRPARRRLSDVTPQQIADAVAALPYEWGHALQVRIALAEYLLRRKMQLDALWAPLV